MSSFFFQLVETLLNGKPKCAVPLQDYNLQGMRKNKSLLSEGLRDLRGETIETEAFMGWLLETKIIYSKLVTLCCRTKLKRGTIENLNKISYLLMLLKGNKYLQQIIIGNGQY